MTPPNTIASDTLVEAIARAICWGDGSQDCAAKCLANSRCCAEVVNQHLVRDAQAALTAITEAGYVIVPAERRNPPEI